MMFHHRGAGGETDLPDESEADDALLVSGGGEALYAGTAASSASDRDETATPSATTAPGAPASQPGDAIAYGLLRPEQAASVSLHAELRRLRESEFRVIEAALDMTRPGAAGAAGLLEEMGFLFAGIRPAGPHKDWLLLQYFNGVLVDYDVMAVESDESHALIAYVRALDPDAA
jgi:hypothetical protein